MDKNKQQFSHFLKRASLTTASMVFAVAIHAQNIKVSGTVKGSNGEPVIGATISVVGTKSGVVTDVNGNYSVNVPTGATLRVSYLGFQEQTAKVNGRNNINFTLNSTETDLNEVVVVGYGTQKKIDVTGSVSVVGSEVLEDRPVTNVSQALQGTVPGLNLTTTSNGGKLNSSMNINIRGTGSIGQGSTDAPLILIDGIEGDLNSINPNDIESISVLKDAASASIYGTRAAFGVILVTTKSGKSGKLRLNYSGDIRFSSATRLPELANSLEWAEYINEASRNSGGSDWFSSETIEKIKNYMAGVYTDPSQPEYYGTEPTTSNTWAGSTTGFANTDWYHEYYRNNAPSTSHNISASGGTDRINYLLSFGYLKNDGILRHGQDKLNRYTFNSKISAQLASWAHVEYATKWLRSDYDRPQYIDNNSGVFFHNIHREWPTNYAVDPNGHPGGHIQELEDGGRAKDRTNEFTQQLSFIFTPVKNWNIHLEGSMRNQFYKKKTDVFPTYNYNVDNTRSVRNSDYSEGQGVTKVTDYRSEYDYFVVNAYTDYSYSLLGKHNFKGLLGLNFEKYGTDNAQASGTNLTTTDFPYLSQTQANPLVNDAYWHRATAGYFFRLNYDYDSKYLLEFNLRYDGSSRFTSENRWAWFPSVSAGWNIARESFFKQLSKTIQTLKLRASWGQLGNTRSGYSSFADWYPFYQQQAVASQNSSWLINGDKQNTASLPAIVNTTMTWETVESWDAGLDFSLFNYRLTGSFDWFSRKTKNMVGPAPILGSVLGTNAPRTNNCDMRSTGWELELQWRDQISDFKYGVKFNLSDATSKILSYPYDGEFGNQSIFNYYNGKKLGEIWGYESHGIAQSNEEINSWQEHNKPNWGSNWQAGDMMYTDINGDGQVTPGAGTISDHGDLKVIGNTTPRYNFGINLNAEWKGFDFSIFFQGVLKRDWWAGSTSSYTYSSDPYFWGATGWPWQVAVFKEHLDYWSEDNKGAYYTRPYLSGWAAAVKNHYPQTHFLRNASYMRCKNLQFGYSLPQSLTLKAGLSRVRLYFSCDNVFTVTGMPNIYDPEDLDGDWGSGKLYPLLRTWSFGLNVTF